MFEAIHTMEKGLKRFMVKKNERATSKQVGMDKCAARECFPTRLFSTFVSLQTAALQVPWHVINTQILWIPYWNIQSNGYFEIYISTKLKKTTLILKWLLPCITSLYAKKEKKTLCDTSKWNEVISTLKREALL